MVSLWDLLHQNPIRQRLSRYWSAFYIHLREVVLKGNLSQSSVVSCVGAEEEP